MTDRELSRRQFLKLSGGIGGGLMLALHLRPLLAQRPSRAIRHLRRGECLHPHRSGRFDPDLCEESEIGQGIKTVFPMIIAGARRRLGPCTH